MITDRIGRNKVLLPINHEIAISEKRITISEKRRILKL